MPTINCGRCKKIPVKIVSINKKFAIINSKGLNPLKLPKNATWQSGKSDRKILKIQAIKGTNFQYKVHFS